MSGVITSYSIHYTKLYEPQVVLRETIIKAVRHTESFERELDGRVQRGEVTLQLSPLTRGTGLRLVPLPVDLNLGAELVVALEETLRQGVQTGPLAGYPLVDLEVAVIEVPVIPGATTAVGVRAAAQRGLSVAIRGGAPTLLEPVVITSYSIHYTKLYESLRRYR